METTTSFFSPHNLVLGTANNIEIYHDAGPAFGRHHRHTEHAQDLDYQRIKYRRAKKKPAVPFYPLWYRAADEQKPSARTIKRLENSLLCATTLRMTI